MVLGAEVEMLAGFDPFGAGCFAGSVQYKHRVGEPARRCLLQAARYNLCSGLSWVRQMAVEPVLTIEPLVAVSAQVVGLALVEFARISRYSKLPLLALPGGNPMGWFPTRSAVPEFVGPARF